MDKFNTNAGIFFSKVLLLEAIKACEYTRKLPTVQKDSTFKLLSSSLCDFVMRIQF